MSLSFIFLIFHSLNSWATLDLQELSSNPRWLALGHYQKTWQGSFESSVRSQEFFLSPQGKENPLKELEASLEAFNALPGSNPELHALCRFPGRALWLKKMIPTAFENLPAVKCLGFEKFSFNQSVESISLVFATGYLSNPASYFGHPLIKFNSSRKNMPTHLLDVSVNYGAVTPAEENGFVYAFKGLFGGYHATFSHNHFYYNNHAYGEVELRDMWEYTLNLNPEEVQIFVAHTWELLGKSFPYVFLSDNCASAMAEMVTGITGVELIPSYLPYALPITLFNNLASKKRIDGSALVSSVSFIPSRQTRLTTRYNSLDESEQKIVKQVATTNKTDNLKKIDRTENRARTIETLFDYYAFRLAKEPKLTVLNQVKRELLLERLLLPPSSEVQGATPNYTNLPPHSGQRPFLTQLSAIRNQSFGNGLEFRIRPAYYDFLSLDYGRPQNSSVRIFDISMNFFKDKVFLRKWDLISIQTLNLSETGLPGDGGYAWNFETGVETVNLGCSNCTAFKIDAGFGKALELIDRNVLFAMVNARAQTKTKQAGQLAGTARVGILLNILRSGAWKSELSLGYRDYIDTQEPQEQLIRWEHRFGFSQNWDIRASYEKHLVENWSLSYARYW